MKYFIKTGRAFFAIALVVYGLQQFYFGSFRNVFFSPYQNHLPALNIFSYLFGLYLLITGIFILLNKNGRNAAIILGYLLLLLFFTTHLTYELISEPNKIYHQGLWVNQLKEIALAGSSFVIAGSFKQDARSPFINRLGKIIPYGNLFFLFTITVFGTGHLVYIQYIVMPEWIHDKIYWGYFTGIALAASGIAIALGIRIRAVALLQALMIFAWVWLIHLPSAISDPAGDRGNLLASMFDALAFSGTSLLISLTMKTQKWIDDLENWK